MPLCTSPDRRLFLGAGLATAGLAMAGCRDDSWYGKDVGGSLPDLAFDLSRAGDGQSVTETDYRGQVVALFFGYTFCPDICPFTLSNLSAVTEALGDDAQNLSILFVTVDPERDTPEVLARYVGSFTPRAEGLRGTESQLARVTRRYRVTYKVEDHDPGADYYNVSHGKSVYLFDAKGDARLLWPALDTPEADIEAGTEDIRRLIHAA